MSRLKTYFQRQRTLGQSLIELALVFPLLLMLLSGVVEFGFAFNHYVNLIEATREGARYAVDLDPCNQRKAGDPPSKYCHKELAHQVEEEEFWCTDGYANDNPMANCAPRAYADEGKPIYVAKLQDLNGDGTFDNDQYTYVYAPPNSKNERNADGTPKPDGKPDRVCETTLDYYEKVACVALSAAEPSYLDPAKDNLIISMYRVYSDALETTISLMPPAWPAVVNDDGGYGGVSRGEAIDPAAGDIQGQWRLWANTESLWSMDRMQGYFEDYIAGKKGTGAGIAVVEVWYHYNFMMGLPWITIMFPNGLDFYAYAVVPVPAGEPKPTPSNTLTPTETPTPTETEPYQSPTPTETELYTRTPTVTPTETPTPTPTETSTTTPTPTETPACDHSKPDMGYSVVNASPTLVWANGWPQASLNITLLDNCVEEGLETRLHDGLAGNINIVSSRAGDSISGVTETSPGQYVANVSSAVVGTSIYTVTVDLAPTVVMLQNPAVNFTCVSGVWDRGYTAKLLQFAYSNPAELGTIRRLVDLQLAFAPSVSATGPFTVTNLIFGGGANIIWNGPATVSASTPLHIGPSDWNVSGTGSRTILMGVTSKPLQFYLGYELASSGTYTLTTTWDDGTGTNLCTSAEVYYPPPP